MNKERQRQLDHERYLREREERLRKQRAYYQEHREQCRESVRKCRLAASLR